MSWKLTPDTFHAINVLWGCACVCLSWLLFLGITITGLESPLTVGESANISCITNEPVFYIQWRNISHNLSSTTEENVTVLNYIIPLVEDDMQGQIYTCVVHLGNIAGTHTATVLAKGAYY